jgi:hypothetical protein
MPDITMCLDHDCPLRETCYRYLAKPGKYQSYFVGSPRDPETGECDHHWKYFPVHSAPKLSDDERID